MSRAVLMKRIGHKENELINTNYGYVEILDVDSDNISLGFIASGHIIQMSIDDFLAKFNTVGGG